MSSLPNGPQTSPPCHRADAEAQLDGAAGRDELLAFCNELLEAERAGARVTWRLRDATDDRALAQLMDGVHADERASCRLLLEIVGRLGGEASKAIGAFEDKVMALEGEFERIILLDRGQAWVVRRLEAMLPRVADPELSRRLEHILTLHRRNVAATARWLDARR